MDLRISYSILWLLLLLLLLLLVLRFPVLHSFHTPQIIKHLSYFSIFSYGVQLPSKMAYKWSCILLFFCRLNCLFTFTLQCWYTAFSLRQHYIKPFSIHYSVYYLIPNCIKLMWGILWHSWLRHYATSWKFEGSIPSGVNVIFHRLHRSGYTMVMGLTSLLPPAHANCIEIWEPQPTATLRAFPFLYSDCFIILN